MLRHASAVRPATSALDAEDNFDGGARSPGTSASLAVSPTSNPHAGGSANEGCEPSASESGEDGIRAGTQGVIVIDSFAVAVFWVGGLVFVFVSTTWTVNGNVPAVVALPEITPFELSFSPVGSGVDPAGRDHLWGGDCPLLLSALPCTRS